MEDASMPGTIEAFARASRHGRFGGDEEEEEEGGEEGDVGGKFFRKQAIRKGIEMEMALMQEERERDKELKEKNSSIVDRRVWENHEIGVGYQHKTVMRQAVAQHEKVHIKDMSKEKKRRKRSAEEKEAEKEKEREAQAAAETEALHRLRALIWKELRQRGRLVERRDGGKEGGKKGGKEGEEGEGSASSSSSSSKEEEGGSKMEEGKGRSRSPSSSSSSNSSSSSSSFSSRRRKKEKKRQPGERED